MDSDYKKELVCVLMRHRRRVSETGPFCTEPQRAADAFLRGTGAYKRDGNKDVGCVLMRHRRRASETGPFCTEPQRASDAFSRGTGAYRRDGTDMTWF